MDSSVQSRSGQLDIAILIFRIASAIAFLYHGSAILFGAFGGPGPTKFAAFMHAPAVIGYLVGLAQFGGGIAMLTGALMRFGTICILIVMMGAIFLVHLPHGYSVSNGGVEYALTQFLLALGLLFTGPGAYSLAPMLPPSLRKR